MSFRKDGLYQVIINGVDVGEPLLGINFNVHNGWAIVPEKKNWETGVQTFKKIYGDIRVLGEFAR